VPMAKPVDTSRRVHPDLSLALGVLLAVVGGILQGLAADTLDGLFVALALLLLGGALVVVLVPGGAEMRAFLLSYGVCAVAGGLNQLYAQWAHQMPMTAPDAIGFYAVILPDPPYHTWYELENVWIGWSVIGRGAALAVQIWQYLYHGFREIGIARAPHIGLLCNAMTVGVSAGVTVRIGRLLYGNDRWRLRRTGTLFALSGMLALFGSIFMRDCFLLLLNTIMLWALVHFLERPTLRNYVYALAGTLLVTLGMWYLRQHTAYICGAFHMLALFCWYWRGRATLGRVWATLALPFILVGASAFIYQYVEAALEVLTRESAEYIEYTVKSSGADSLGVALVTSQPLPIRTVLGTGVLLAFPIPIWSYLAPGATEYELLKTWQAVYKLFVVPLALAGLLQVARRHLLIRKPLDGRFFIAAYTTLMVAAVAATSLETRHVGQCLPAIVLLAVLPDTRTKEGRRQVASMAVLWIGTLTLVHVAWAGLRFL